MQHPGEGVGPEACAKTAQTSTCIHTKRRVALYRFGHSSVPCRQRPIPHPAGPSIADFEETQPSHMQAQWSPRKPVGRTPNVILAKSCAHQEAARRSSTLNQELDNFRFDSSWTGPECNVRAPGGGVWRPCTRMTCSLLEPGAVVAEERVERMAGCAGVRRYPSSCACCRTSSARREKRHVGFASVFGGRVAP